MSGRNYFTITVSLDQKFIMDIDTWAKDRGLTRSKAIRYMVNQYMKAEKKHKAKTEGE